MTIYSIDPRTVKRLPLYLQYLKNLNDVEFQEVSSKEIAYDLRIQSETVQNDFTILYQNEIPTSIFKKSILISRIRQITNIREVTPVIVIGAGRLGRALLGYSGFIAYDLDVIAAFDINQKVLSKKDPSGKPIYHLCELIHICKRIEPKIGIIAVPSNGAQDICDQLVSIGIKVIWNFSTTKVYATKDVSIKNHDLTMTLVQLSKQVK